MKTRLRLSRSTAILIVCLAGVYWHYSRQPLYHTDLWGHLAYGRWIVAHGRLPATEPFMPLAHGVPIVDSAWLAQYLAHVVYSVAGYAGLQVLHALAVTAGCAILAWSVGRRTKSALSAGLAMAAFIALEWYQFRIIRPQMAGLVCFVALEALLTTRLLRRQAVWIVPLLFVAWANLHGSFVTGLGLIAMSAGGRLLDVACQKGSLRDVFRDRRLSRLIRLTVCGAVAALLNPYGPRLYFEILTFAENPNLRDLIEWTPLSFGTWQGRTCAAAAILILLTVRATGRRPSATTWLPFVVFGAATVWSARMLVWWSPLAASLLAVQINVIWQRLRRDRRLLVDDRLMRTEVAGQIVDGPVSGSKAIARAGWDGNVWAGVALAAVFLSLAAGPIGRRFLGRDDEIGIPNVSPETPVEAVAWLREHPPTGLVFNTYEWGDYLIWAGPPDVRPFVTSHVHILSPADWRVYRSISRAAPGCLDRLDTYRVGTVLLDRLRQPRLVQRLEEDGRWARQYVDSRATIFARRPPSDER